MSGDNNDCDGSLRVDFTSVGSKNIEECGKYCNTVIISIDKDGLCHCCTSLDVSSNDLGREAYELTASNIIEFEIIKNVAFVAIFRYVMLIPISLYQIISK